MWALASIVNSEGTVFCVVKKNSKNFFSPIKNCGYVQQSFSLFDAPAASAVLITSCGARGQVGVTSGTL